MSTLKFLILKFAYLFSSHFYISYFLDNCNRNLIIFRHEGIDCFEIDAKIQTISCYAISITKIPGSLYDLYENKVWPKYKQLYWKIKYDIEI